MAVLEAEGRPFAEVQFAGLAVRRTRLGLHSGFLYQRRGGEPRILHLAFHYDLRDDQAASPYRWAQIGLDEVNKEFLAELAHRVAHGKPSIAYGFNAAGIAIDPESGEVLPAPTGHGLTCATFITALLRAHAYELVDLDTWPERADDIPFQGEIVSSLREHGASDDHVDAVQADIGSKRLRPDEVVGSGVLPDEEWAVEFAKARQMGDEVQQELPPLAD